MKRSTAERGYGWAHQQERKRLAPLVATGQVTCYRCRLLIPAGAPWDLGHNDTRTAWTGPEHRSCNRRAGARHGNRLRGMQRAAVKRVSSMQW